MNSFKLNNARSHTHTRAHTHTHTHTHTHKRNFFTRPHLLYMNVKLYQSNLVSAKQWKY